MPDVIGIISDVILVIWPSTSSQMCGNWNLPMFLLEGWAIHADQYCFFDVSSNTIVLPSHNTKIVQGYFMACVVLVVYDW